MHQKEFPWAPTWLAFLRIFSDIAYATDIATEANIEDIQQAPRFEQRYKSVTNLVRQRGTSQIIELAAGLSSRGLFMTNDPSVTYIETDLAEQIQKKARVVESLLTKVGAERPNLKFAEVNALDYKQLMTAAVDLTGPITIVSEGLFSYQEPQNQRIIAQNVHQLLSIKGGVWITPDITTRAEWARSYGKSLSAMYAKHIHLFESEDDIDTFFAEIKFRADKFRQSVLAGELVSVERLRMDRELVARRLSDMRIYCLTPQ